MISYPGFAPEKYDLKWFTSRASNSFSKVQDGVYDYTDSCLLYLPKAAEIYEQRQEEGDPYGSLVTAPEKEYLTQISQELVALLPQKFEYVDLGPGTAHKEQYFFDEIFKTNKEFVYKPVDINSKFLEMAAKAAEAQKVKVEPILCSFEELPEILSENKVPRFVSLGLTVIAYHPDDILPLLKEIAGEGGSIFVTIQARERDWT